MNETFNKLVLDSIEFNLKQFLAYKLCLQLFLGWK